MIKSQKMCPQYSSKYTLARHGCTGITQQFPVSGQLSDHAYSGYQAPIFLPHEECGYKATLQLCKCWYRVVSLGWSKIRCFNLQVREVASTQVNT